MITIKQIGKARYIINGYIIVAKDYRNAVAQYLSVNDGGAKPIFGSKELKC